MNLPLAQHFEHSPAARDQPPADPFCAYRRWWHRDLIQHLAQTPFISARAFSRNSVCGSHATAARARTPAAYLESP
jgi:hypothetical protein